MPDWGGFDEFYRSEHPRVLASLTLVSGSLDPAREATDEAFARALDRWDRVREMAAAGGWVYRVALNDLRRRMRRAALERRLLARRGEPVMPPSAIELWDVVRHLPERQRVAVVLRYVADLPEREVSIAMGVARGTVSAALTAARARLADLLADGADVCLEGRNA